MVIESKFIAFDVNVFSPHTWGALETCGKCKKRPAAFMKPYHVGPRRTARFYPFCVECKERELKEIAKHMGVA
jgi:hypothetical protein